MSAPQPGKSRLARLIRQHRLAAGWARQEELAERIRQLEFECSQNTVSGWEQGIRVPDADRIAAMEWLFGTEGALFEAMNEDAREAFAPRVTALAGGAAILRVASAVRGSAVGWLCRLYPTPSPAFAS